MPVCQIARIVAIIMGAWFVYMALNAWLTGVLFVPDNFKRNFRYVRQEEAPVEYWIGLMSELCFGVFCIGLGLVNKIPQPFVSDIVHAAVLLLGLAIVFLVVKALVTGVIYQPSKSAGEKGVFLFRKDSPGAFWLRVVLYLALGLALLYLLTLTPQQLAALR